MGAEKIYDKMPEKLDFMQVLSIFIHSSFTDSGYNYELYIEISSLILSAFPERYKYPKRASSPVA